MQFSTHPEHEAVEGASKILRPLRAQDERKTQTD